MKYFREVMNQIRTEKFLYLILGYLFIANSAYSQNWIMRVMPNSSSCNASVTGNLSAGFSTASSTVFVSGALPEIVLTGPGPSDSSPNTISSNVTISLSGGCSTGGSISATYKSSGLATYGPTFVVVGFFSNGGFSDVGWISGNILFYPQFRINIDPTNQCNGVIGLSEAFNFGNVGSYVWEVTDNPSPMAPPSSIKIIKTTSSSSTTVTNLDLESSSFSTRYGNRWVRVRDSGLAGRNSNWRPLPSITNILPHATFNIISTTDPNCHDETNGSIRMNITSSDVSVLNSFTVNFWDRNSSSPSPFFQFVNVPSGITTYTGLAGLDYKIEVVNSPSTGGCSTSQNKSLINPLPVTITNVIPRDTNCKGINIGSDITVSGLSGGSGLYTVYKGSDILSSGATPTSVVQEFDISIGTYSISSVDSHGCSSPPYTVTISEPATVVTVSLSATPYSGYEVSCNGSSDGAITATPGSGALPNFTYEWYSQPGSVLIPGQTGQTLPDKAAGKYFVKLTDGNGCIAESTTIMLAEPPALDFTIDPSGTLLCAGDMIGLTANGASTYLSTVDGQRLPLSYVWDFSGETEAGVTNKAAGDYGVTVSDKQGCNLHKTYSIVDPPGSTVTIAAASDFNGSSISCNGKDDGALVATVVGTVDKYTWYRNNASHGFGTTLSSITNLEKGDYKVVVTYNTNCKAEAHYNLSDPEPISVNITPTTTTIFHGQAISCYGKTDANLKATAMGGTLKSVPYDYAWNVSGETNSLLTNVGAGDYEVEVTDENGCIGTKSISLSNPDSVKALITHVSDYTGFGISCNGLSDGEITAAGQGGTGVYNYTWSNNKSTAMINDLVAGYYTVTVSDENGCRKITSKILTEPTAVSLQVGSKKDLSCFESNDGFISLLPGGGVGTYEYSRDGGSSWKLESEFNFLKAEVHVLSVRDKNDCLANVSTTLTQPSQINISFNNTSPALCTTAQGAATSIVSGGIGGYSYEWKNRQNQIMGTNPTLSNVKGGVYTIYVKDAGNCLANKSVPITSTDGAQATWSAIATSCFNTPDGSAIINIISGDGPYTFLWPDGQSTTAVNNMASGLYYVEITDAKNCTIVAEVDITSPTSLQLATNVTLPTCSGSCDGQMSLVASGGVGNYTYQWNGQTSAQQTQLCAGTFPITVSDDNGCILNQEVILIQPDPLSVIVKSAQLPTCRDRCDGVLEIEGLGGNGGYQYLWSLGGTEPIKTNLCPQTYSISVTDSKGCQGQSNVVLENIPALSVDFGGGVTLCAGQTFDLDAGAGWKDVQWTSDTEFSSQEQQIVIREPGVYNLQVTNTLDCIGSGVFIMQTSTDLLKASFMIPEQAAVGDTVAIIDISWPLPESIEWDFPNSMSKVGDLGDVVFGQFYNEGTFTVGLTAHLGECLGQLSKTITISAADQIQEGGRLGYEEYVKEFTLHPNPNDGSFDVEIELAEEAPIMLSVWNTPTGLMLKKVQHEGSNIYKLYFDLRPLSPGTYVLRLDHKKGKEYIRFVVY